MDFVTTDSGGTPLKPENVNYHLSKVSPDTKVFYHPVHGWLSLYVLESTVLERPYAALNGSINDRYFRKESAALRALDDYASLRTSDGLTKLCQFHYEYSSFNKLLSWVYDD